MEASAGAAALRSGASAAVRLRPPPQRSRRQTSARNAAMMCGHERRAPVVGVACDARAGRGPVAAAPRLGVGLTLRRAPAAAGVNRTDARGPRAVQGAIKQNEPPIEQPNERTVSEKRIYSWEQWDEHRNSNRYFRHLAAMPTSRIVRGLLPHVVWVCSVATGVAIYGTVSSSTDNTLPHLMVIYKPFEMTSFALALLLVFRTDASYGRFLNARSSWRLIISQCREINRLASCYFHNSQDTVLLEAMNRWTAALAWCFRDHLLPKSELEWKLTGLLRADEIAAIQDPKVLSKPAFVFIVLSQIINRTDGDKEIRGHLLDCMCKLEDTLAECERLLKTPIPLSYTRHTSRFLIIYLSFIPFGLWDECGWGVIPISGLVAFFLFGIDEIGVQIEEPFSILPLDRYCQTILQDSMATPMMLKMAEDLMVLSDQQQNRGEQATTQTNGFHVDEMADKA